MEGWIEVRSIDFVLRLCKEVLHAYVLINGQLSGAQALVGRHRQAKLAKACRRFKTSTLPPNPVNRFGRLTTSLALSLIASHSST